MRGKLAWPKLFGARVRRDSARSAGGLGEAYDRTRRGDPEIGRQIAARLALPADARVLDLACGTGNYAAPLAASGLQVTGGDRDPGMLATAAAKLPDSRFCRCEATALPFAPESFAGAICVSALHLFEDLPAVMAEAARVLAPGGRFVLFTTLRQQMRGFWLNRYFPDTMERAIGKMPDQNRIEAAVAACGFDLETIVPWEVPTRPVDLFLYAGKHVPGIYLDRRVRTGISAFAQLAEPKETVQGVRKLTADIASGRINRVMAEFEHDQGDYSFLTAVKARSVRDPVV